MTAQADWHLTRFVQSLRPRVRGEVSLALAQRGGLVRLLSAPVASSVSSVPPVSGGPAAPSTAAGVAEPLPETLPCCRLAPRDPADVSAALALASESGMPVLFGSRPPAPGSPAAINAFARCRSTGWLLIDDQPHLGHIGTFDQARGFIEVEAGVRLAELNRFLMPHGLWLPIEGAQAAGRTVASLVATNEAALNPAWGAMVDRLLGVDALLADGTAQLFGPFGSNSSINLRSGRAGQIVSALFGLAAGAEEAIRQHWPAGLRQPDGYLLDCFRPTPARPYTPDGSVNLAHLLAGSQGTLAWSARLHLRLLPRPGHHQAALFVFASLTDALKPLPALLSWQPSALLLVDGAGLQALVASGVPADRALVQDVAAALARAGLDGPGGDPVQAGRAVAVLVRFSGDDEAGCRHGIRAVMGLLGAHRACAEEGVALLRAGEHAAAAPGRRASSATSGESVWQRLLDGGQHQAFDLDTLMAARRQGWLAPAQGQTAVLAMAPLPGQPARLMAVAGALEKACQRVGIRLSWRGDLLGGALCLRPLDGPVDPARAWAFLAEAVGRLQAGRWHPGLAAAFAGVRRLFDPGQILAPGALPGRGRVD